MLMLIHELGIKKKEEGRRKKEEGRRKKEEGEYSGSQLYEVQKRPPLAPPCKGEEPEKPPF